MDTGNLTDSGTLDVEDLDRTDTVTTDVTAVQEGGLLGIGPSYARTATRSQTSCSG